MTCTSGLDLGDTTGNFSGICAESGGYSVIAVPFSMPLYALNADGSVTETPYDMYAPSADIVIEALVMRVPLCFCQMTTTLIGVIGCDATLTFISKTLASLVPSDGLSYIVEVAHHWGLTPA